MSREILFRGKRIKTGKWGYGDLIRAKGKTFVGGEEEDIFWMEAEVYPATVGQYTGLCDKNGAKIFEGDIVDIWSAGQHCHGLVKWGQGSVSFFVEVPCTPHIWHLSGGGKNYDEETCEVIGNIHDNPELVKEESK